MTSSTRSQALVTGGTGFIAMYVIKRLLENGHVVHTTVRSLKDKKKSKSLFKHQSQYPDHLRVFEADLMKAGSFGQAMTGCDIVYHIASPFLVPAQIKDGLEDCVEPALNGTRNVLTSVNETSSVTRVVLTSSIAATYGDSAEILKMQNKTLSENSWNESSTVTYNPYSYSKVVAEREAWDMWNAQSRWQLVVINPGLVIGPSLSPESASGSLYMLEAMYKGENKMGVPELHYPIADVREIAEAHVRAGEDRSKSGRFIIASDRSYSLLDMANLVRPVHENPKLLPRHNLPKLMVLTAAPFMGLPMKWVSRNIGIGYNVNNNRSRSELGIRYRPAEETLRDHYQAWLKTKQ